MAAKISEKDKRAQLSHIPKDAHADKDYGLSVKPFSPTYSAQREEVPLPKTINIQRKEKEIKQDGRVIIEETETVTEIQPTRQASLPKAAPVPEKRPAPERMPSNPSPDLLAKQNALKEELETKRQRLLASLAEQQAKADEDARAREEDLNAERRRLQELEGQKQAEFDEQIEKLKADIERERPQLVAARARLAKAQEELAEAQRRLAESRRKREEELNRVRAEEARKMEELRRLEEERERRMNERACGKELDMIRQYVCVHDHNPETCPICRNYAHDDIPILPY
eukprot:GHVN01085004.1.p1 GENE.GHVN01085004.1~~GHVN01085004.1.p1  ORF type:complete len:285 (+),score=43.52 GHVN01085004.1:147-1001(+)